jgi:hypothetical protein
MKKYIIKACEHGLDKFDLSDATLKGICNMVKIMYVKDNGCLPLKVEAKIIENGNSIEVICHPK